MNMTVLRSRKSCEYGFGIPAGFRPANRLNQNPPDSGFPPRFKPKTARSNDRGRPVAFALTPGNVADVVMAVALLGAVVKPRRLLAESLRRRQSAPMTEA
jgi:hypothetical protein